MKKKKSEVIYNFQMSKTQVLKAQETWSKLYRQ